jgi:hypothetical protein
LRERKERTPMFGTKNPMGNVFFFEFTKYMSKK